MKLLDKDIDIGDLVRLELDNLRNRVEVTLIPPMVEREPYFDAPSEVAGYCVALDADNIVLSSCNPLRPTPAGIKKSDRSYSLERVSEYVLLEKAQGR